MSSLDLGGSEAAALDSTASKAAAALCAVWCLAFFALLVGVMGGPLLRPLLAALGLLPVDGAYRAPDVVEGPLQLPLLPFETLCLPVDRLVRGRPDSGAEQRASRVAPGARVMLIIAC